MMRENFTFYRKLSAVRSFSREKRKVRRLKVKTQEQIAVKRNDDDDPEIEQLLEQAEAELDEF